MRFIARLITDRTLEREVQNFAPDLVNAEGISKDYLQAHGKMGDSFSVFEIRPVLVSIVSVVGMLPDGPIVIVEKVKEEVNEQTKRD